MNSEDTPRHYTINEASRALGIHPKTFERLRKKYGIKPTGKRHVGRNIVLLFSEAEIGFLRSERKQQTQESTRHDSTEQSTPVLTVPPDGASTALAVTETHEHARALAVIEHQESVNMELVRIIVLKDQRIGELEADVAALTARQHTPRRHWWQRRQREDA